MPEPFTYWECPECGWDCVTVGSPESWVDPAIVTCPLCASDSGHRVSLRPRPALETDRPEGVDERFAT